MSIQLWRQRYKSAPVSAVSREITTVLPDVDADLPPIVCVTGDSRGAAAFSENWLGHIAQRGHVAHAVSVRGQGNTPKADGGRDGKVHDLVQTAASVSRQCVLIGHDRGAGLVAHALTRYPAAAAIFVAPRGLNRWPGPLVGEPRVLVAGSPDDRKAPEKALDKTASLFGQAPLLFPGVGHDFMADAGWQAPLEAILDWLNEVPET